MTEPISVRIARLRGCEPVHVDADDQRTVEHWRCACKEGHAYPADQALLSTESYEAWLQPAAWALLLSEMVEAHRRPEIWISTNPATPKYAVGESHFNGIETGRGDTLGEAVALAWISWREAQR